MSSKWLLFVSSMGLFGLLTGIEIWISTRSIRLSRKNSKKVAGKYHGVAKAESQKPTHGT